MRTCYKSILSTEQPPALGCKLGPDRAVRATTGEPIELPRGSDIARTVRERVAGQHVTPGHAGTHTGGDWGRLAVLHSLSAGGVEVPVLAESKERTCQRGRLIGWNIVILHWEQLRNGRNRNTVLSC